MPIRNNGDRPPKGKLELTRVGKENRSKVESRILPEDPEKLKLRAAWPQ